MLWAYGTDSFSVTDFAAHLPATDDLTVPNIKKHTALQALNLWSTQNRL